jgi:hypothetical protein
VPCTPPLLVTAYVPEKQKFGPHGMIVNCPFTPNIFPVELYDCSAKVAKIGDIHRVVKIASAIKLSFMLIDFWETVKIDKSVC